MFYKKAVLILGYLVALTAVPAWALDEKTAEVTPKIESEQPVAAKDELSPGMVRQWTQSADDVAGKSSGKSWWTAITDGLGLTDSDPGITVDPVASKILSPTSDYVIGPGDIIGVSVWKDDNLTRTVVVMPDGKISLPLVGELVAEGKTVAQFKREVERALSRYTADSTVTVEVKQLNSMFIYVIGRVNIPGRQSLVANTNVLQALAMVGGPNPFAKTGKIKIFRQHEGKTATYSFNYDEIMEGRHLETNIELKRGDVIIVP